jgi:hypothetical protein
MRVDLSNGNKIAIKTLEIAAKKEPYISNYRKPNRDKWEKIFDLMVGDFSKNVLSAVLKRNGFRVENYDYIRSDGYKKRDEWDLRINGCGVEVKTSLISDITVKDDLSSDQIFNMLSDRRCYISKQLPIHDFVIQAFYIPHDENSRTFIDLLNKGFDRTLYSLQITPGDLIKAFIKIVRYVYYTVIFRRHDITSIKKNDGYIQLPGNSRFNPVEIVDLHVRDGMPFDNIGDIVSFYMATESQKYLIANLIHNCSGKSPNKFLEPFGFDFEFLNKSNASKIINGLKNGQMFNKTL